MGQTAQPQRNQSERGQKLDQQILLLTKDGEAEKHLAEFRTRTLEESLARQSAQMAALEKQLEEAKRQVQEIAVKAIEGASGARALSHINEIAMEQAKHRAPQG
jgi:colicin import membrane protein